MPKFEIDACETVYYRIVGEAENIDELDRMIRDGEINWGKPVDGDHFEVLHIEEIKEEINA